MDWIYGNNGNNRKQLETIGKYGFFLMGYHGENTGIFRYMETIGNNRKQ